MVAQRYAVVALLALGAAGAFAPSQSRIARVQQRRSNSAPALSMMSEEETAIVPSEDNVAFSTGVVGAVVGGVVLHGGLPFAVVFAAVANYISKQENGVGDVSRTVGKAALGLTNFVLGVNSKYRLVDKAGNLAGEQVDKLKLNPQYGDKVEQVSDIVESVTKTVVDVTLENDLLTQGVSALGVVGDNANKAIEKGIDVAEKEGVVDKAKEAIATAVDKAKAAQR